MARLPVILKKTAINMALMAVFCFLAFAITMPLLAELSFTKAESLVAKYKWPLAEDEFRKAIKLDPFNAKYLAGLGNFLVLQAKYRGNKTPYLDKAEMLFAIAKELNPFKADAYIDLALLEMDRRSYDKAFGYFRKAAAIDPNGFNAAYSTGMAGIEAWRRIGEPDRSFVLDRMKIAILARPSNAGDVYSKLWNARKDFSLLRDITPETLEGQRGLYDFIVSQNLWQFRKEQTARVEKYKNIEDPEKPKASKAARLKRLKEIKDEYRSKAENKSVISAKDWQGKIVSGKNEYEYGNMYWSGTMDAVIDIPEGDLTLKIRAKGQPAGGVYPYMIVELDGEEVGEAFVDSPGWKEYEFKVNTAGGVKVLSITFPNDWCDAKEDRNLFVESVGVVRGKGVL